MIYRILKGRWGEEGWVPGKLVAMDEIAATARVSSGDLELVGESWPAEQESAPSPEPEAGSSGEEPKKKMGRPKKNV